MTSDGSKDGVLRTLLKRLRNLSFARKVLVIVLAALLVAMPLLLYVISELRPLPLGAGSTLEYALTGSVNHNISGYYNVSIDEYAESSQNYHDNGTAFHSGLEESIEFPVPIYRDEDPEGMLVGYDRTMTALGEKSVETWFEPLNDRVMISEIGMESSILYRIWVVFPGYYYSFSLVKADQTHLDDYDNSLKLPGVHSLIHPSEQSTCHLANYFDGGWGSTRGVLEISNGERVRYDLTGNATTCLFFDISDIDSIKDTGLFQCNASLSRLAGDPGETDVQAQPGTYWYVVTMSDPGFAWMYW